MKKILIAFSFLLAVNAQADIEHMPQAGTKATAQEIAKSRACFKDLEILGCGDPGVDHQQFRSCLNNVFSSLNSSCKKMMSELYGVK